MLRPFLIAATLLIDPLLAQEVFPVELTASTSTPDRDGKFILRMSCRPSDRIPADTSLRIAFSTGRTDLAFTDAEMDPPPKRWRDQERIDVSVELTLPFEEGELEPDEILDIRLGFVTPGVDPLPPAGELGELAEDDGLTIVADVTVPRFAGPAGEARLAERLKEGRALRAGGSASAAWALVEEALRGATDDRNKALCRDALREIGEFEPAPLSAIEEMIVARRIREEQTRVFREEAGRLRRRGELHAALALLEEVGGALSVDAEEKVIGALADAERMTESIQDLRESMLTALTEDQEAQVEEQVEEHGRTEDLFDSAQNLAEDGERLVAMGMLRKLRRVDGVDLYDRALELIEEIGEEYIADIPEDQEQALKAVLEHPAWGRTEHVASHAFIYIGPRELVEGIPKDSQLHFDLAYVHLTDLFGRKPNPEGDRVTVYFKELWDFGGGVGGGKIINIGRANPSPRRPVRVDNGLLYHELTHCVDDTWPIHSGFREGLANLGAAYAFEALDQKSDALHSFENNLKQFQAYFVQRDLEYWRIQNYGPSAGFLLHFVDTYASRGRGEHDWSGLRRFFREYRTAPVKDGRESAVIRAISHYLTRAYGPQVFDDLVTFGFPLVEEDREQLGDELWAFIGEPDIDGYFDAYAEFPNSMLPRDTLHQELAIATNRNDLETAKDLRRSLGIVDVWKVVGPFFARRADPGAHVFEPELRMDYSAKPATLRSNKREETRLFWQDPVPSWTPGRNHRNVELHPDGHLRFDYEPYGDDNSAIYAATHVTVPAAVDALAHLRVDDEVDLFVNDLRVGDYRSWGRNGSTQHTWRGPWRMAPDAIRFPIRLESGRNKILVKIRNRGGTAGVTLALSRSDGSPLVFEADSDPPDDVEARADVEEPRWKRTASIEARSLRSKTQTAVGGFSGKAKVYRGTDTGGGVGWRMFTVRPGFPKDSPSNLAWMKESLTKDMEEAVRVDILLTDPQAPKMVLTVQGEGGDDGLSGWNLILVPSGKDAVEARLERYDRLVLHTDPLPLGEAPEDGRTLSMRLWDGWVSASIDETVLFDRASIDPIAGRHRVGFATWGENPGIGQITLFERGR